MKMEGLEGLPLAFAQDGERQLHVLSLVVPGQLPPESGWEDDKAVFGLQLRLAVRTRNDQATFFLALIGEIQRGDVAWDRHVPIVGEDVGCPGCFFRDPYVGLSAGRSEGQGGGKEKGQKVLFHASIRIKSK